MSKKAVSELGILGGKPLFAEPIHLGAPELPSRDELLPYIDDILARRWVTNNGKYVQELEQSLCDFLDVNNCIAVCNGTTALEIAIRAVGLRGEVILPSLTFIATAHALQWQGVRPVFCDVDPQTHCIEPDGIPGLLTDDTSGILGVHLWGTPCDVGTLAKIAADEDLVLLYDAAHAFGCSTNGTMIGNFGRAEIFSFHATKFFNTFEGGAIATNDDELAKRARLIRNFGFSGYDNVSLVGINGKMNEISAAAGLILLSKLPELLEHNRLVYRIYENILQGLEGVRFYFHQPVETNNCQYIVLEIDSSEAGFNRDVLLDALWAENIRARRYFYPGCHRMKPYRSSYPEAGPSLPITEALCERVICLPAGSSVLLKDAEQIAGLVRFIVENRSKVASSTGPVQGKSGFSFYPSSNQ